MLIKFPYAFFRTRNQSTNIAPHKHERHELVYFFSGDCLADIGNAQHALSSGHYYFLKPNVLHNEFYRSTGESLVIWFEMEGDFDVPSYIVQTDSDLSLRNYAERIRYEIETMSYGFDSIINSLVMEMMVLLGRQWNLKITDTNSRFDNIITYMNEYYMTNIKIADLAKSCNYSVDHFRVIFQKITGKNPKNFILDKRIELAKSKLKDKQLSITEIGELCGFEYYSQFCSVFKKKTGLTPAEYRKKT